MSHDVRYALTKLLDAIDKARERGMETSIRINWCVGQAREALAAVEHVPSAEEYADAKRLAVSREWASGWNDCRGEVLRMQAQPAPQGQDFEWLRVVAVEAIRNVTGCPDIKGNEVYLTEELIRLAKDLKTGEQP